jgi:non-specific serine/threonine protein kinase
MLIADRYELEELPLGQGGMGAVYGGHDKHLDRRVAVKFLHLRSRCLS